MSAVYSTIRSGTGSGRRWLAVDSAWRCGGGRKRKLEDPLAHVVTSTRAAGWSECGSLASYASAPPPPQRSHLPYAHSDAPSPIGPSASLAVEQKCDFGVSPGTDMLSARPSVLAERAPVASVRGWAYKSRGERGAPPAAEAEAGATAVESIVPVDKPSMWNLTGPPLSPPTPPPTAALAAKRPQVTPTPAAAEASPAAAWATSADARRSDPFLRPFRRQCHGGNEFHPGSRERAPPYRPTFEPPPPLDRPLSRPARRPRSRLRRSWCIIYYPRFGGIRHVEPSSGDGEDANLAKGEAVGASCGATRGGLNVFWRPPTPALLSIRRRSRPCASRTARRDEAIERERRGGRAERRCKARDLHKGG